MDNQNLVYSLQNLTQMQQGDGLEKITKETNISFPENTNAEIPAAVYPSIFALVITTALAIKHYVTSLFVSGTNDVNSHLITGTIMALASLGCVYSIIKAYDKKYLRRRGP